MSEELNASVKKILYHWDIDDDYSLEQLIADMRAALTTPAKERAGLSDREVIDLLDSTGLDITGDPAEAIEIFKSGFRLGLKQRDPAPAKEQAEPVTRTVGTIGHVGNGKTTLTGAILASTQPAPLGLCGGDAVEEALRLTQLWAQAVAKRGPGGAWKEVDEAQAALRAHLSRMAGTAGAEFCCEHSWAHAKQIAWKERDLNCGCDHNESCPKCFPPDFRHGGKWASYAAVTAGETKP